MSEERSARFLSRRERFNAGTPAQLFLHSGISGPRCVKPLPNPLLGQGEGIRSGKIAGDNGAGLLLLVQGLALLSANAAALASRWFRRRSIRNRGIRRDTCRLAATRVAAVFAGPPRVCILGMRAARLPSARTKVFAAAWLENKYRRDFRQVPRRGQPNPLSPFL